MPIYFFDRVFHFGRTVSGVLGQYVLSLVNRVPATATFSGGGQTVLDYAEELQSVPTDVAAFSGMRLASSVADGAVVGADVVTGGDFDNPSDWPTVGGTASVAGGQAILPANSDYLRQATLPIVTGKDKFLVTIDIDSIGATSVRVYSTATTEGYVEFTTAGVQTKELSLDTAALGNTRPLTVLVNGSGGAVINSVSVKKVIPTWVNTDISGNPLHPVIGGKPALIQNRQDSTAYSAGDQTNFAGAYWGLNSPELQNKDLENFDLVTGTILAANKVQLDNGEYCIQAVSFTAGRTYDVTYKGSGDAKVRQNLSTAVSVTLPHTVRFTKNDEFRVQVTGDTAGCICTGISVTEVFTSADSPDALGTELVTNGTFDTDTDWIKGTGWSITGAAASAVDATSPFYQTGLPLRVGASYLITYTLTRTAGSIYPVVGSNQGVTRSLSGIYTEVRKPTSTSGQIEFWGIGFTGSIDNVSIKEVGPDVIRDGADVLGPDVLAGAGSFDAAVDWDTVPPAVTIDGTWSSVVVSPSYTVKSGILTVGKEYDVEVDVISGDGSNFCQLYSLTAHKSFTSAGHQSFRFIADGTDLRIRDAFGNPEIDNLIVREVNPTTVTDGTCTWDYQGRYQDQVGYLSEPARTNKCTCRKHNPVDTSGLSFVGGDGSTLLEVVDVAAVLDAAGLSSICTSGKAYRFTTGGSLARVYFDGATGNVNQHSMSVYWWGSGTATLALSNETPTTQSLPETPERAAREDITPLDALRQFTLRCDPGSVIYFILPQLEEGPFVTSTIIDKVSDDLTPVTRPATVLPVPSKGFLRGNNLALRGVFIPKGISSNDCVFCNQIDADNLLIMYYTSTTLVFFKRCGSVTSIVSSVALPFVKDRPVLFDAYLSDTLGIGVRVRTWDGYSWTISGWGTNADTQDCLLSDTAYIGTYGITNFATALFPWIQTKFTNDPKAWLEAQDV